LLDSGRAERSVSEITVSNSRAEACPIELRATESASLESREGRVASINSIENAIRQRRQRRSPANAPTEVNADETKRRHPETAEVVSVQRYAVNRQIKACPMGLVDDLLSIE
jgi:hypothetical protein